MREGKGRRVNAVKEGMDAKREEAIEASRERKRKVRTVPAWLLPFAGVHWI